jgi:hypothetical protein
LTDDKKRIELFKKALEIAKDGLMTLGIKGSSELPNASWNDEPPTPLTVSDLERVLQRRREEAMEFLRQVEEAEDAAAK